MHALICHTLGPNFSEEVGVFCRLRVVLTAEAFLSNFLTGILEGERPLLRMALGQIRGGLSELRWPRGMVRQRGPGMHSGVSFSSWVVEGSQPISPAHSTGRTWEIQEPQASRRLPWWGASSLKQRL